MQFTAWVDAVIFVFSLENEASFNAIYNYYTKMAHFRSSTEIPLILVGTQGQSRKWLYILDLILHLACFKEPSPSTG
jgi:GTPase SAR1 family protein